MWQTDGQDCSFHRQSSRQQLTECVKSMKKFFKKWNCPVSNTVLWQSATMIYTRWGLCRKWHPGTDQLLPLWLSSNVWCVTRFLCTASRPTSKKVCTGQEVYPKEIAEFGTYHQDHPLSQRMLSSWIVCSWPGYLLALQSHWVMGSEESQPKLMLVSQSQALLYCCRLHNLRQPFTTLHAQTQTLTTRHPASTLPCVMDLNSRKSSFPI